MLKKGSCKVAFTGVVVSSNQVAINGSNYVPDGTVEGWSIVTE